MSISSTSIIDSKPKVEVYCHHATESQNAQKKILTSAQNYIIEYLLRQEQPIPFTIIFNKRKTQDKAIQQFLMKLNFRELIEFMNHRFYQLLLMAVYVQRFLIHDLLTTTLPLDLHLPGRKRIGDKSKKNQFFLNDSFLGEQSMK